MVSHYKNKNWLKIQPFYNEQIKSVKKKGKRKIVILKFLLKNLKVNYKTIIRCTSISTQNI